MSPWLGDRAKNDPWRILQNGRPEVSYKKCCTALTSESFLNRQPYSETAAQLILMAYLQRIVNGGGAIDREYAAGSGRIDLCVRWPLPDGST